MFWRKKPQVKHLLNLLRSYEAWSVERVPVYISLPGNRNRIEAKIFVRHKFSLVDGEFVFYHTLLPQQFSAPPKDEITFPTEYNIDLTRWEHNAIVKAVRRVFNAKRKCREQEKQTTFITKLLK